MGGMRVGVMKPQLRYWRHRPKKRVFVALDLLYRVNNIVLNYKRYKGHGFGASISYGYSWILSHRWNIEASLGAGVLRSRQRKADKGESLPPDVNDKKLIPIPTSCSVSFVYIIK